MSLSNAAEAGLLSLLFENANFADIGDATGLRGSTVAGSLYVALHTADPGEAGTQATSECAYTGYARVAVARTTGAWTVTGTAPTTVANDAAVSFAECTAGSSTATHFSVGVASSGATVLLWSGALTASRVIDAGETPSFAISALTATLD